VNYWRLTKHREPDKSFILGITIDLASDKCIESIYSLHLGFWSITLTRWIGVVNEEHF